MLQCMKSIEMPPQTLDLTSHRIEAVTAELFKQPEYLKTVILTRCGIKKIEDNAFAALTSLEDLILMDNELTEIGEKAFAGAIKLKAIFLIGNKIEKIDLKALALPALEDIRIGKNQLKTLPDEVFTFAPNLKVISLYHNQLTDAKNLYLPSDLVHLDLGRNPIPQVDLMDFLKLKKLKLLYLDQTTDNIIFPTESDPLSDLEELSLDTDIPMPDGNAVIKALFKLPRLQYLRLKIEKFVGGVQIESIFEKFPDMGWLFINNCEVKMYESLKNDECVQNLFG